jgi:hypothetical protein
MHTPIPSRFFASRFASFAVDQIQKPQSSKGRRKVTPRNTSACIKLAPKTEPSHRTGYREADSARASEMRR